MENNINLRIRAIRKELKLNQSDFAESLGYGRGVIENIELGRVEPKPLLLQQICKMHNVDPKWLETGEGEMFLPRDEESTLTAYAEHVVHNKDLNWIKQLNLTLMSMTPEELAVMEKFAITWLENMKKEQE